MGKGWGSGNVLKMDNVEGVVGQSWLGVVIQS